MGFPLIELPLIDFVPVNLPPDFELGERFSWIFFTSAHGAEFFLKQRNIPIEVKVACTGAGTAKRLAEMGCEPSFTGVGNNTENVALEFQKRLSANDKVLFPISDISLRRIQKNLPGEISEDVVVYKTVEAQPNQVPHAEIGIFTSPSNVHALKNKADFPKKLIAIGPTTQAALKERGLLSKVASSPGELDLWAALFQVF